MAKKITTPPAQTVEPTDLFSRIVSILEQARANVVRSVNSEMVLAYWHIGREIVQELQGGEERAGYGTRLLEDTAAELTKRYSKGFSVTNLRYFRLFYQIYNDRIPEIRHTPCDELPLPTKTGKKHHKTSDVLDTLSLSLEQTEAARGFSSRLSWSHYRTLCKVENRAERLFYEIETEKEGWSVPQLERQIHTFLFTRLCKSKDKAGVMELASKGQVSLHPVDILKDPYVLEFLDLPESHKLSETKIETALIGKLQDFLLELGSGFAFIGRQKRLTLDGDHFYPDLIFYHTRLKCYVVIDLKTGKLTHGDLGQMQMYVNFYDREIRTADDNPTVGLLLCAEKNDSVVRYVLGDENQQIFASKYCFELPTIEQLEQELRHERILIENILVADVDDTPKQAKRRRADGKK